MLKPSPEGEGFNPTQTWDNKQKVLSTVLLTFLTTIIISVVTLYLNSTNNKLESKVSSLTNKIETYESTKGNHQFLEKLNNKISHLEDINKKHTNDISELLLRIKELKTDNLVPKNLSKIK